MVQPSASLRRKIAAEPAEARWPQAAAQAACVLMVALPLVMWAANRSAPLIFALSTIGFIGASIAAGGAPAVLSRAARALFSSIGLALGGFALWALVSLFWSHRPLPGLALWGEFALPIVCGLAIVASTAFRPSATLTRALAIVLILASLLMLAELASGLSQRIALGIGMQMTFIFNRPVLCCLLLAVPTVHALWTQPSKPALDRMLAALVVLAVGAVVVRSESEAAKLGLVVLVLAWALARVLPRLTLAATALAFAATMMLAPMAGTLADRAIPPAIHESMKASNSRDRVDIWLSFGEAVASRLLIGAGFGASAALQQHPVAAEVSAPRRVLLGVGHPHSMPLQAWVETGLVGVACLAAAGLLLLARLTRLSASELAPRLAVFASAFAIASVGHGAWQGWWIAVLGAVVAWFWADDDVRNRRDDTDG